MHLQSSFLVLAGMALGVATPVLAQDAPPAPPSSGEKVAKPKKVCRVDPTLGSVMPRYVCHSKEEWAAIDKETQQAADGAMNGTTGAMGNGGGHTSN